MKLEGTFAGEGWNGHYLLVDVDGDIKRDHIWLNAERSAFPGDEIPHGARIRFYCSVFSRGRKPPRYTDVREVQIISLPPSEGKQ